MENTGISNRNYSCTLYLTPLRNTLSNLKAQTIMKSRHKSNFLKSALEVG